MSCKLAFDASFHVTSLQLLPEHHGMLHHAAPGLRMNYTDDFTQATYTLNTRMLAFEDAEDICNDIGGHAVSYGSIAEHVAVENFYVSRVSWQQSCISVMPEPMHACAGDARDHHIHMAWLGRFNL